MSEDAFTYQPLSAEADTRIIELQPAPDASYPLHCRIAEICLSSEDLIDYEALSYTWGQPDFSESLFVLEDNGQTSVLNITFNLKEALQRLRLPDKERQIWVDAVCIDQQDESDKSNQIPSMAQIYKSAVRVLVWLGWSPEGQRALIGIKKAMRFHSRNDEKIKIHKSNLSRSFENLVKLPWFSRRWVIQEVVLAADVVMMCGVEEIPLVQLLRMVISSMRDAKTLDTTTQTALEPLAAISKLWRTWVFDSDQDKGPRLFDLLQAFANFDCAVEHDKIFALCGLASDCLIVDDTMDEDSARDIMVVINYRNPVERLFRSLTNQMLRFSMEHIETIGWMHLMKNSVSEEISDAVIQRCNGHYRSDLPPWTPDWRLPRRREALHKFFEADHRTGTIGRNLDSECNESYLVAIAMPQNMLKLQEGEVMGLVTSVLEPFPEHPNTLEIKGWLQTMRIGFLNYGADSRIAQPWFRGFLCRFFGIEVDNLPSDRDTTYVHPDGAWCYFLLVLTGHMFHLQRAHRREMATPDWSQWDLYHLSSGRTDIDTDSRSWSLFCSAFRGRRLFLFKVDEESERSAPGMGIGPDHLAVGNCFKTNMFSTRGRGKPLNALSWDLQTKREPTFVGDVWHFRIDPDARLPHCDPPRELMERSGI